MIARYRRKALVWGVPGLLLQGMGILGILPSLSAQDDIEPVFVASFFVLMGTAFLIYALACYAWAKGRHGAWSVCGLFSLIGFIVLFLLPDTIKARKKKRS